MPVATIGLDLEKNVFQVHDVDADGQVVLRRKLRRSEVLRFFEALPACKHLEGLWTAIGHLLDAFTQQECVNYFAAAGYDAT